MVITIFTLAKSPAAGLGCHINMECCDYVCAFAYENKGVIYMVGYGEDVRKAQVIQNPSKIHNNLNKTPQNFTESRTNTIFAGIAP